MSKDIRIGRWLQIRGRVKMWWARLMGDEALEAAGNGDVVAGTLQESYGRAKKQGIREVRRGIDAVAKKAKDTLRTIDSAL